MKPFRWPLVPDVRAMDDARSKGDATRYKYDHLTFSSEENVTAAGTGSKKNELGSVELYLSGYQRTIQSLPVFTPGSELQVEWTVTPAVAKALNLKVEVGWRVEGAGRRDQHYSVLFDGQLEQSRKLRRTADFVLPQHPRSYVGQIIYLIWEVRVTLDKATLLNLFKSTIEKTGEITLQPFILCHEQLLAQVD